MRHHIACWIIRTTARIFGGAAIYGASIRVSGASPVFEGSPYVFHNVDVEEQRSWGFGGSFHRSDDLLTWNASDNNKEAP